VVIQLGSFSKQIRTILLDWQYYPIFLVLFYLCHAADLAVQLQCYFLFAYSICFLVSLLFCLTYSGPFLRLSNKTLIFSLQKLSVTIQCSAAALFVSGIALFCCSVIIYYFYLAMLNGYSLFYLFYLI